MYRWKQFTELPKIKNLSTDDQRREYYRYQNKMLEAVSPSSAASAAAGSGGGSLRKIKTAEAAIYYRMEDGVFQYSVTNFETGKTSALATRNYTPSYSGIDWTFQSQKGGFMIWIYDDTAAKDYLLFIDVNGVATEIALDYSLDLYNGTTSQHMIVHYQDGGTHYFIVFDGDGLRQFKIDEYVANVFWWAYDNSFLSGFCFQTQSDNIARLYAVRNGSSTPVLISQIDSDVQNWGVYLHDLHDRIMIRKTNTNDNSIESITVYDPTGTELANIDTTPFASAPYVIQNGDNKTDVANNQGTTVAVLEMLNPEYDLDNMVEGDTILGYSTLDWYDLYYLNSNNNAVMLLHTDGLTNDGNFYVVLYCDVTGSFSLQTVSDSYYQFQYDFYNTAWDATDDSKSDSVLFVFFSDYEDYDRSDNQFVYANDTLFLPVFSTDTVVMPPVIFASQSDTNAFDFRNKGFHRWNDPRLGSTKISMIIDENRRDTGLFHFTDYGMGLTASIDDGGYDMYDTGNTIVADLNTIYYTHTQISEEYNMNEDAPFNMGLPVEYFKMDGIGSHDPNLGVGSSYFTNLYPGLFVFSARNVSINQFGITGYTGLDHDGYTYSNNFQITSSASNVYQVFVKCLYDDKGFGSDPSINQIIIVNAATASGIEHIVSADTDEDIHSIVGLSGVATQVHYLLMAQRLGVRIEDDKLEEIARTYINMVDMMSNAETLNELNANYRTITKLLDNTSVNFTHYTIDADRNETYTLIDNIYKNERIDNTWLGKTVTRYETRYDLEMFGDTGWTNLPDVEGRSWTTMKRALQNQIGNWATSTELVMWSLETDNYYKIDFTSWSNGGGNGGFAYTRQLITEAMDEPVIAFTHSNGSFFNEVDVIEPGILELSRGSWGPLVNVAKQTKIYDEGPVGTLWNSQYANERKVKHTLVNLAGEFDTVSFKQYPEQDDWWVDTFYSIDMVEERALLSYDGTWNEFNEFYDSDWGPSNFITDDRYNQSTSVFTNEKKRTARILHKNGISGTFSLTAEPTGDVLRVNANDTNVLTIVHDETGYEISYWELDGTLIDRYTVTDTSFANNYNVRHIDKRSYVYYWDDEEKYTVLVFDGKKIKVALYVSDVNNNFNQMYNDRED